MLVVCPGCSATATAAAWAALLLLPLLLAVAAYVLGRLHERIGGEAVLRQARTALRQANALQDGWSWQTDAGHRLRSWYAPGHAALPGATTEAALIVGHATLAALLHAEQAFADVAIVNPEPLQGSRGWVLRGVPHHDDSGRFAGFTGTARPSDDTARAAAAAAALLPLLDAYPVPALLAQDDGAGWQLQRLNPAAQALWPALRPDDPLDAALEALPAPLIQALEAVPPVAADHAPWQVLPLTGLPPGRRAVLLRQAPQAAAARSEAESDASFTFTVSHDLRAPIRVVEGFTRIVKEDYGRLLDRVGNDHLDRVLGAAARMNLMIDALLTLAKLSSQPLARQPVNLSQLAGYVVDDLKRAAPERDAEVQIEPGLAARGDPTLLRLVLENLLGNAWKYSARSPKAQISLRRVAHDGGPGSAAYCVRDNGAGFDMRSADRLFGLFQRLHSASEFPGHGVGLASVRRIVRRHGGDIWAEAEPGRGAAFYFTLAG